MNQREAQALDDAEFNIGGLVHREAFTFIPFAQDLKLSFGFAVDRAHPLFFAETNHFFQQSATYALVSIILGNLDNLEAIADTWRYGTVFCTPARPLPRLILRL